MKNPLSLFVIVSLFCACTTKTKQTVTDTAVIVTKKQEVPQQQFKSILPGVWVRAEYYDDLRQTKSPLIAQKSAVDITSINVSPNNPTGNTVSVPVILNNHEGMNITLNYQPGKTGNSTFGDGEIEYSLKGQDTILTLHQLDKQSGKISAANFYKVADQQPENKPDYGISYAVNKALGLAGNYIVTDNTGAKFNVSLSNDGKVTGFLNYTTYNIQIDFGGGDNTPVFDQIYFGDGTDNNQNYNIKFNGNNIMLYNVGADSKNLGKLKYTFAKQN